MANRAYLRVWTRDFAIETMIAEFARFLASVPLSESHAGFDQLTVQAVDATETPIVEWDMHEQNYGAAEVAALAAQQLYPDVAYIVNAKWDLWAFDIETLKWQHGPRPLVLLCQGKEFDGGAAESEGPAFRGPGLRASLHRACRAAGAGGGHRPICGKRSSY